MAGAVRNRGKQREGRGETGEEEDDAYIAQVGGEEEAERGGNTLCADMEAPDRSSAGLGMAEGLQHCGLVPYLSQHLGH